MTLQYRMVVQSRTDNLLTEATRCYQTWLSQKDEDLQLPQPGTRWTTPDCEISNDEVHDDRVALRRHTLSQTIGTGRWTTTLVALTTSDDDGWLWVDLEWVSDDPWGTVPQVGIPGIVGLLLSTVEAHVGATPMPASAIHVAMRDVEDLAALILDPRRTVPVVVLSRDYVASRKQNRQRGERLARELRGTAPVYLLEGGTTTELNKKVGPGLHVVGGAARTYLPGVSTSDSGTAIRRHRVLGGSHLRNDLPAAARLLAHPLRAQALAARPPRPYRDHGLPLLRRQGQGLDEETLLKDLVAAEETAEILRDEVTRMRDDVEWQALAEADTERELQQSQARVRWLEGLLAEQGRHVQGEGTPAVGDIEVHGFDDVLIQAGKLAYLQMGSIEQGALELDQYPQAESWARKAWRALAALNDFAEARAAGWAGDFRSWCVSPASSTAAVIPVGWVAMRESDSVTANPRYRDARSFSVPESVSPQGVVYMPAHIKLVEGGRPAPRIHFHDDMGGTTNKIYVGHLGPHLPNDQTN